MRGDPNICDWPPRFKIWCCSGQVQSPPTWVWLLTPVLGPRGSPKYHPGGGPPDPCTPGGAITPHHAPVALPPSTAPVTIWVWGCLRGCPKGNQTRKPELPGLLPLSRAPPHLGRRPPGVGPVTTLPSDDTHQHQPITGRLRPAGPATRSGPNWLPPLQPFPCS